MENIKSLFGAKKVVTPKVSIPVDKNLDQVSDVIDSIKSSKSFDTSIFENKTEAIKIPEISPEMIAASEFIVIPEISEAVEAVEVAPEVVPEVVEVVPEVVEVVPEVVPEVIPEVVEVVPEVSEVVPEVSEVVPEVVEVVPEVVEVIPEVVEVVPEVSELVAELVSEVLAEEGSDEYSDSHINKVTASVLDDAIDKLIADNILTDDFLPISDDENSNGDLYPIKSSRSVSSAFDIPIIHSPVVNVPNKEWYENIDELD